MPQIQLPIFPEGVTNITAEIGFIKKDGIVTYFNGHLPVFTHNEKDIQTFRMITSQFVVTGLVRQIEIAKVFGVPLCTVKRYVKIYREKGPKRFYETPIRRRAVVLIPEVLEKAQGLLDEGKELGEVGKTLGIKTNTLNKAVHAGKLHRSIKKKKPLKI
ncbi:MAG: hypothetical protein U9Q21_01330 [Candidatus Auribacterota bacterium]|nr:hypothetical protein [Candidatus Auribacterota bacterium]